MEFQYKVYSKELFNLLYESGKTIGTAESCTSGKVAETITLVPGASDYFKGGIVSYSDEVKVKILGVDADVIADKTAVCEEVAIQMVKGALKTLEVDYAVSITGFAGPGGAPGIPVGTIWVACGNADEQVTLKLSTDNGRDRNVGNAVYHALALLLQFVSERETTIEVDDAEEVSEQKNEN